MHSDSPLPGLYRVSSHPSVADKPARAGCSKVVLTAKIESTQLVAATEAHNFGGPPDGSAEHQKLFVGAANIWVIHFSLVQPGVVPHQAQALRAPVPARVKLTFLSDGGYAVEGMTVNGTLPLFRVRVRVAHALGLLDADMVHLLFASCKKWTRRLRGGGGGLETFHPTMADSPSP